MKRLSILLSAFFKRCSCTSVIFCFSRDISPVLSAAPFPLANIKGDFSSFSLRIYQLCPSVCPSDAAALQTETICCRAFYTWSAENNQQQKTPFVQCWYLFLRCVAMLNFHQVTDVWQVNSITRFKNYSLVSLTITAAVKFLVFAVILSQ